MSPRLATAAIAAAALLAAGPAAAQRKPPYEGFLCCNVLNDRGWANDINYRDARKELVPAGTPVKVTGYGRYRVQVVTPDGKKFALGNDYSRRLSNDEFADRYVLPQDPKAAIDAFPPKVRAAIAEMKLVRGMTRQQVLMSVGYPPAHYTPDLEAPLWSYWADSGSEFQVFWGPDGKVDQIFGRPEVRERIVLE